MKMKMRKRWLTYLRTSLPERPKFNGGTAKILFSPGEKCNHILYRVEEDEIMQHEPKKELHDYQEPKPPHRHWFNEYR